MKVDYDGLSHAAACMTSAASQVTSERSVRSALASGAPRPDDAHPRAVGARGRLLAEFGEMLRGQGRTCEEMIGLFRLLDAQVAAAVPHA